MKSIKERINKIKQKSKTKEKWIYLCKDNKFNKNYKECEKCGNAFESNKYTLCIECRTPTGDNNE